MGGAINFLGGVYEMLRMGVLSGFRFRSAYWTWRTHTAFPGGKAPFGVFRPAVEYFMWVWRIRRLR